jgi:hypothetical protein
MFNRQSIPGLVSDVSEGRGNACLNCQLALLSEFRLSCIFLTFLILPSAFQLAKLLTLDMAPLRIVEWQTVPQAAVLCIDLKWNQYHATKSSIQNLVDL